MAAQRDRESGQTSLFGMLSEAADQAGTPIDDHRYPDVPEWEPRQTLAFEKEALGFYVSGHPLDRYLGDLKRHATATTGSLEGGALQSGAGLKNRAEVIIGGMVTEYRERPLRSGNGRMAIFQKSTDRPISASPPGFSPSATWATPRRTPSTKAPISTARCQSRPAQ